MNEEMMLVSEVIEKLKELKKKYGDVPVCYVSQHDWVIPISCISEYEDEGWEGEPEGKYIGVE